MNSSQTSPISLEAANGGDIVCKFGGTSCADAEQIRKVESIVRADSRRRYVIVSAPGKRAPEDKKITDLLLTCWHLASQKLDFGEPLRLVRARYEDIARGLDTTLPDEPFAEMRAELAKLERGDASTLASHDWMAARGEYFNARLIADYLGATFVPAGDCVRFDAENQLDELSYELLRDFMKGDGLFVVPGFYGRDHNGRIKTFPRGGSDITGAVVARAVGASLYENWTDVSGLLMADPRVVENPKAIAEVTYRELRELAYAGASVLHEETIFPASQAEIPIQIKNTNAPQDAGTRIVRGRAATNDAIVGIAGRTGFSVIAIEKAMMNRQRGFGRRVLEVLEAHGVSFEHMPSAIDSMSVIVSDDELADKESRVLRELQHLLEPDRLEIQSGLALIATVGEGMAQRVGVAGTLFAALRDAKVNVRMISQGASEINIIVGVSEDEYKAAVRAIYDAFVD